MSTYTEEEAKAKWCPFARQLVSIEGDGSVRGPIAATSANRFMGRNEMSSCIGSGCMAWRTKSERKFWSVTMPGQKAEVYSWNPHAHHDNKVSASYVGAVVEQMPSEVTGYCGLAGAPQ